MRSAGSRRPRRPASTPGRASAARSARRPPAPPCRTARRGCASPAPIGGSSGPRISRPRRDRPHRFRSATGTIVTVGDRRPCGCACPAARGRWRAIASRRERSPSLLPARVPALRRGDADLRLLRLDRRRRAAGHRVRAAFVGPVCQPRRPDHRAARAGSWSATPARCRPIPTRTTWSRLADAVREGRERRGPGQRRRGGVLRSGHRCARRRADGAGRPSTGIERAATRPPAGVARPDATRQRSGAD